MIQQRDLYEQYPKGMESKSKEMNAKDTASKHALHDTKDFIDDLIDEVMKLQTKHDNPYACARHEQVVAVHIRGRVGDPLCHRQSSLVASGNFQFATNCAATSIDSHVVVSCLHRYWGSSGVSPSYTRSNGYHTSNAASNLATFTP